MEPLFEFLKREFDISLCVWHNIPMTPQDESVKNITSVLASMDPIVLNSVF